MASMTMMMMMINTVAVAVTCIFVDSYVEHDK